MAGASSTRVLSKGTTGEDVRRLERRLTRAGFPTGPRDGVFDEATEEAVKAFQSEHGLDLDGVVGPATWAALGGEKEKEEPSRKRRSLSEAGAAFIGRFEGFSAKLYNDPAGHATIGYGHLVHRGSINGSEPAEFKRGISKARGLELLGEDARVASTAVNDLVKVQLTQHQFDALVSFVFNLGTGAFGGSTLLRNLNSGQYATVPSELNRWINAGGRPLQGLINRRRAEGLLFSTASYG